MRGVSSPRAKRLCLPVPSIEMIGRCLHRGRQAQRAFRSSLRYGSFALSASGDVRNDGRIGREPAREAADRLLFAVGAYFKFGNKPIRLLFDREQDRAAPRGTGDVKVGGNYAASLLSGEKGHEMGYSNIMYLDAAEHKYIEECGAANFFGIKDGKYITPKSPSVLPSITNMSLRQIARDMGLVVEERHIPVEELESFEECGAWRNGSGYLPYRIYLRYADRKIV